MFLEVKNYYDSHVHWLGTAEVLKSQNSDLIQSPIDLVKLAQELQLNENGWIYSFGWGDPNSKELQLHELDRLFPKTPVFISHKSGHQSWVNSLGLQKLGLGLDKDNLLKEKEHFLAYKVVNQKNKSATKDLLLQGARFFNSKGITHIRDMTSDLIQFEAALELESENQLTIAVESFFDIQRIEDLDSTIKNLILAKKNQSKLLRPLGVKFFLDGDIGRRTASFSNGNHEEHHFWSDDEIYQIISESWKNQMQIAVHAIGDLAVDKIVDIARDISGTGLGGKLNLEHAEVISPKTFIKMKALHVSCHFQPCHFFSDADFLYKNFEPSQVFSWGGCEKNKIPFFFGTDSPVMYPDLSQQISALKLVAKKSQKNKLLKEPLSYFSHPDPSWISGKTQFDQMTLKPCKVEFDGKTIFESKN